MTDYVTIKTAAGLALDAAAATGQKLVLTAMALGDGGGSDYIPDSGQTALKGEKARVMLNALTQQGRDLSQWVAEAIFPPDQGGFTAREAGLFTQDGTLYAIANLPPIYRPTMTEGAAGQFILSLNFAVSDASNIVINIDPTTTYVTQEMLDNAMKKFIPYTGGDVDGALYVTKSTPYGADKARTSELGARMDGVSFYTQLEKSADGAYTGRLVVRTPDNATKDALSVDMQGNLTDAQGGRLLNKSAADDTYLAQRGGTVIGDLGVNGLLRAMQTPPQDDRSTLVPNTEWVLHALKTGSGLEHALNAESGYTELPGGLILQWGWDRTHQDLPGTTWSRFKIRFPNACFAAWVNERQAGGTWKPTAARPTLFGVVEVAPEYVAVRGLVWADEPNHWPVYAASYAYLAIGY